MLKKVVAATGAILFVLLIVYRNYDYIGGILRIQPDFELSANPPSIVLYRYKDSFNSTTITVRSVNGFNGNITFRISQGFAFIGDVKLDLDLYNVHLPANGQAKCVLTLVVISGAIQGEYYVDIVGVSGQLKHSVRIFMTIQG